MVRGLVERSTNTEDQRSFLYKPTFQMLSFLGLTSVRDMPDYDSAQAELKNFKESQAQEDTSSKEESV